MAMKFSPCTIGVAAMLAILAPQAGAQTPEIDRLRAEIERGGADADAEELIDLGTRLLAHYLADGMDVDEVRGHSGLVEARDAFQRAADLGDPEALNSLAAMLRLGEGGPQDVEEADRMLHEAARSGSAGANLTLSRWYREGLDGFEQSDNRALEYMTAAAETGNTYTQWLLAMMILEGVGTEADATEAYRWVERASNEGDTNAMVSRGVMLAIGEGVTENDSEAREWYRRAAESNQTGFDAGLKSLGFMLITGEGGPADPLRGFAYILVAAAAGNSEAELLKERFENQFSDDEFNQALELGSDWIDEHIGADESELE